jgi:hypothetical protein
MALAEARAASPGVSRLVVYPVGPLRASRTLLAGAADYRELPSQVHSSGTRTEGSANVNNSERNFSGFAISRRRLLAGLGVVAVAGVGGRSFISPARAQSAGGVFVGKIDGTNAFVGIVTDGEQAEAYVCNGVSFNELFTGTMADAHDGQLTLVGEDGDLLPINVDRARLQSLLASGGSLTGAMIVDGNSNPFQADPASGPGALYLSIGTLPDGSTMDGGTIVLNNGDLRGFGFLDDIANFFTDTLPNGIVQGANEIASAVSTFVSSPTGQAIGNALATGTTLEESGGTAPVGGQIGLPQLITAGVAALTGNTQAAINTLNGCTTGQPDPRLCSSSTANVNNAPIVFTAGVSGPVQAPTGSGGAATGGTAPTGGTAGGATATPAAGGRGAGSNSPNSGSGAGGANAGGSASAGGAAGGSAPGSAPLINPQPIAGALKMMQTGQALTGPNGPQPVTVPLTAGGSTANMTMTPQTPAKLAQNGPPH